MNRAVPAISDPGHFALKNAIRAAVAVPPAFVIGLKVFDQRLVAPAPG